eukprot:TRINITY_DN220_c0_g1_i1.p1 TRINITY_DN220_c0_g1~~TRINITY_DN220_c0_g1_i1.p1  ORF type:complete len:1613 (-),score=140.42 TRINITY_DN220_c0_g1_i1:7189-12027(-)
MKPKLLPPMRDHGTFPHQFFHRTNSRSEVFLIIYKIACIFLFAFFYNAEYSWLLVAVLFLGSIYSYWQCKVERPYYNETLAILWDVTNVVYLYVNSVLFLCMLLKDTNFAGGLQLIVLGIPIVAVVEYLRKHPKCKWITKEFDLLEDGLECSQYLRYFTYVVQNKHELENKVMLEGFINKHIEACNEENCQIKIYRDKYSSKATVGRNALAGKMVLATYLKKLHKKALKRFPTCPTLRIRYAFFLLEIMQDTLGAQKQLQKARANNPQLDEDFVIFRYSRIIEEQMAEYKHQGEAVGMDRVSLIAYDNYFRQCKKKMKEAAKLHMEFWAGLNAQVPDITQLIKIGGKINKVISEIEEYWGLLQGLNANMPKAIRRYAKFLRDVLGDEDNAKELLKSIKQDNIKRPGKELDDIDNEIDYGQYFLDICSSDGTPCICISGEVENLGIITSVNKALCRVFGYSPVELMGQHMNKLIPPLLVTHHTNIVKAVTENPDSFQLLNKELLIPCQLSNGYVLMVHKTIKALPSFSNNMNYVVTFKIDRASEVKNVCHLLLDDKGFITSMSGSNFSLLDSLQKRQQCLRQACLLSRAQSHIQTNCSLPQISPSPTQKRVKASEFPTFCPDAQTMKVCFFSQSLFVVIGDTEEIITKSLSTKDYRENYTGTKHFKCHIHPMSGSFGYIVKLAEPEIMSQSMYFRSFGKTLAPQGIPHCEFYFNTETGKYRRKMISGSQSQISGDESHKDSSRKVSSAEEEISGIGKAMIIGSKRNSAWSQGYTIEQLQKHLEGRTKKYAAGIKTFQLINGEAKRVRGGLNSRNSIFLSIHAETNREQEREIARERSLDKAKFLSSRKQFQQSLSNQPTPGPIRNLLIVSITLLLSFVVLTGAMYGLSENTLFLLRDTISLAWKRSETYFYACDGVYLATSLALVNNRVLTNYENATNADEFEKMLRDQIRIGVDAMLQLAKEISILAEKFPTLSDDFLKNKDVTIMMYMSESSMEQRNYNYMESTYMITSSLLKLSTAPLNEIKMINLDLMFLRDNVLNGLSQKGKSAQEGLLSSLLDFISKQKRLLTYIMVAALGLYFVSALLLYPFLLRAHWAREEVLAFFLRMPRDAIVKLQERCEHYFTHKTHNETLGVDHTEEYLADPSMDIVIDNHDLVNADEPNDSSVTKKREFLKVNSTEWSLFWKVLMFMLLLDAYCVGSTLFVSYVGDVISNSVSLIYTNSNIDYLPILALISLREEIMNSKMKIFGLSDRTYMVSHYINAIRAESEEVLKVLVSQRQIHSQANMKTDYLYKRKHIDYFNKWMYNSVCDDWEKLGYFTTQSQCENFASGILVQGYYNLLMEYVFLANTLANMANIGRPREVFNSEEWISLRVMAKYLIHEKNNDYMQYIISLVADITQSAQVTTLGVALCFLMMLVIGFFVLWVPYILRLRKEICRTNAMLLLIPTEVYMGNRYLREAFDRKTIALTQINQSSSCIIINCLIILFMLESSANYRVIRVYQIAPHQSFIKEKYECLFRLGHHCGYSLRGLCRFHVLQDLHSACTCLHDSNPDGHLFQNQRFSQKVQYSNVEWQILSKNPEQLQMTLKYWHFMSGIQLMHIIFWRKSETKLGFL